MALENPLISSPGNSIMSAISPYTEFSLSPDSPATSKFQSLPARNSAESMLRPNSFERAPSSTGSNSMFSPSDVVGPSPVTSNGTEIEDEISEGINEGGEISPPSTNGSIEPQQTLHRLSTILPDHLRTSIDDESTSVIHAPEGFKSFFSKDPKSRSPPRSSPPRSSNNSTPRHSPPERSVARMPDRSTPTPYQQEDVPQPTINIELNIPEDSSLHGHLSPISPPPITTDIPPSKYPAEVPTPRAQTRQEVEDLQGARPSSSYSLEGIPEEQREEDEFEAHTVHNSEQEVYALKAALNECWTLCNTLASLSSIHRERIFSYSGTGDAHEKAWKCCWKLCQKLYESRDEDHDSSVRPPLDMCRDFCQALFDVRQRKDEIADSVLRVSFELNNHLYNTHDRNLPEQFRERTLDFYITLCHRLMKQRNELAEETDALLRACWSLAEMLFSLRQNKREGKPADEELLGSAVQACWELCDLFREGWTQVRPERGTPRPSQTTFSQVSDQLSRGDRSNSLHSKRESLHREIIPEVPENPIHPPPSSRASSRTARYGDAPPTPRNPETPTTEFEDTPITPGETSPQIPNILVLSTDNSRAANARWSTTSAYSQGSNRSSSTVTSTTKPDEDINLTRLKVLIVKAAMNVGFSRTTPTTATPSNSDAPALQNFVKNLPTGSFGSLPAHAALLTAYRNLVLSDPTFRSANALPGIGKKASAVDISKSVSWMMRSGQYTFLKDLFKLVFGFHVEEADKRKSVVITV